MNEKQFEDFKAKLERDQAGVRNAYKTLYLAPGADATVVGANLQQLDFENSQGRDETKIAAAAGIPP
jgi:phage portal protein BeeE